MTYGEQNTEKEAHEILSYAFEHGINALDTAEAVSGFVFDFHYKPQIFGCFPPLYNVWYLVLVAMIRFISVNSFIFCLGISLSEDILYFLFVILWLYRPF